MKNYIFSITIVPIKYVYLHPIKPLVQQGLKKFVRGEHIYLLYMTNIYLKRRLTSAEEVKLDLRHELPLFYEAFEMGIKLYNEEINSTPIPARIKSFEATLQNAKMVQALQFYFPDIFSFGKYKRVVGSFPGYQVLVKKLNSKGLPMNIKTRNADAINNQLQLSLFDSTKNVQDAVLFFGYEKNRIGEVVNPQLICIDNGAVLWRIDLNEYSSGSGSQSIPTITMPTAPTQTLPAIRVREEIKEAK